MITYRSDLSRAIYDTRGFGVSRAEVILAKSMADKAKIIKETGIKVYFDDTDEVITHIPEDVTVFKVRNSGNYENGKWLYSKYTGTNIDE